MSSQPRKTLQQIDAMREGGKVLAQLLVDLKAYVQPGMTEREIDAWVGEEIVARGAIATYKTSEVNFPGNICISVNEQSVHSIPSDYVLEQGDIVSFDLVIEYKLFESSLLHQRFVTSSSGRRPRYR